MQPSTEITCCDLEASSPLPSTLPATRAASTEMSPVLAIMATLALGDCSLAVPTAHPIDLPDVIAAERQHTYLHVSSFLI